MSRRNNLYNADEKNYEMQTLQKKPNSYGKISKVFGFFRTLGSIYTVVAALSIVGMFFYSFGLILLILCSFFTLLAVPSFMALFSQGDKAIELCIKIFYTLPIGAIVAFISAIGSSIFIRKDSHWTKANGVKHKNLMAIILSIICAIIYGIIYWLIKSGNLTFG